MNAPFDLFARLRMLPDSDLLSQNDFDPNAIGSNGQSLLHEAIASKKHALIPELIRRRVPVNHQNKSRQSALHYAAIFGDVQATENILASGGDPNLIDKHGNNALWAAVLSTNRAPRIIELLVAAGADPSHKNKVGKSVLDFARESENRTLWAICGKSESEWESQS
jgi:ankyrin repeat protein